MKVLFCAYDRPGHLATGPNAWIQRLVPDLINIYGLDVHTLFIYSGRLEDCPTLSYFKAHHLPVSAMKREEFPFVADQVKALLRIVKKESISIVVANLVIPAFYATRYLKPFNIPVIGLMHSNDTFYKGVISKFIHGTAQDQLTASVAVSHYINGLCKGSTTSTALSLIPCGTPMPEAKTVLSKDKSLKVMYAGRLEIQQKQILKLTAAFIAASERFTLLRFSIYGDGSASKELTKLIEDSGTTHVTYQGAAAPAEMLGHFKQHQVFTLMSDYEGMPVALMEAMVCGVVPVCLAETSGINEIIEHGVNGFIVKDRTADYQKHLQLLLEDKGLWQRLSHNAINTIKERYSSAKTHKQWFELLNSFKDVQTKQIKVPKRIKLEGELLYYGDNRKPTFTNRLQNNIKQQWMNLRLFVRPRFRLRALLKK
jgi:colanic acid/amylovoran biosynthesis glycosyltransferase